MDQSHLLEIVLTLVTLVLSITVHEYAHALAAYTLGDDYAAREGRLTLNPAAHADPVGTLLLPALATFTGVGFGWGKPVPYIASRLSRRFSMRAGEAMVAFAGPLSNLIMAVVCGGLFVSLQMGRVIGPDSAFVLLLGTMVQLNLVLFFFNLIPVPPLDGSKIIAWLVGQPADKTLDAIADTGPLALMVVVLVGGTIVSWPVQKMADAILLGFVGAFS